MKEEIYTVFFNRPEAALFQLDIAGISYCDGTYLIHRKKSEVSCFEYIYRGTGTVIVDNQTFHPSAGDIYMLPAGRTHYYYADAQDPWVKIWFNVSGPLVESLMEVYGLEEVRHVPGLDLSGLFENFLEVVKRGGPAVGKFDQLTLLFQQILTSVYHFVNPQAESTLPYKVRHYLDRNLDRALDLKTVSERYSCSSEHIIRVFKAQFGVTPYQYFLQRKLGHAKRMLTNTALKINEISERLGFCDEHYFSGYFKKMTGISPAAYRKRGDL